MLQVYSELCVNLTASCVCTVAITKLNFLLSSAMHTMYYVPL